MQYQYKFIDFGDKHKAIENKRISLSFIEYTHRSVEVLYCQTSSGGVRFHTASDGLSQIIKKTSADHRVRQLLFNPV